MSPRTLRTVLVLLVACACALALRASEEVRHTRSLTEAQFSATGLGKLSSDQLAVLDALVRRDLQQAQFTQRAPLAERFSDRLTADEQRNAGLEQLSADELATLNATVQARLAPPASGGYSLATSGGATTPITSVKLRRDPQIHGSVSLMVAAGSHDYRAYGGAIDVWYDDPQNNFTVAVGIAQIRSKGGLYRHYWDDGYRYHRPFHDPLLRRW